MRQTSWNRQRLRHVDMHQLESGAKGGGGAVHGTLGQCQ